MSSHVAARPASIAAGTRGWIGRALGVLALSLAAHAIVLYLGQRALHIAAAGFGAGALIEVTLRAPEPIAAPQPKAAPRVAQPAPAPRPVPRAVEAVPTIPGEPARVDPIPPQPEPPAVPVGEAPLPNVNPEPPADSSVVGAFDASGDALLAELDPPPLQPAALPASARYVYRTTGTRFAAVTGTTTVQWRIEEGASYSAQLLTTVVGLTILELKSSGRVERFGLAPERYTEKAAGRAEWATNFDWGARRVTFSSKNVERELREGIQDRLSFQFQLMALGQRLLNRFRPGASIALAVGSRDDIATYRFDVLGPERLQTGAGEFDTIKFERPKSADGRDSRIEVWLAPAAAWLPVKLRFTDRRGEVTENVLAEVAFPAQ
jgi:hypothetical protein